MLKVDPRNLTKPQYVCTVFWMEGTLSQGDIANRIKWTKGQVNGWIDRNFRPSRALMTKDDRQMVLNLLEPLRHELEVMEDKKYNDRFQAKPIDTRAANFPQIAKEPAPEFPDSPEGRKAKRKYEAEQRHKENSARHKRSQGHARKRGFDGSALEWLSVSNKLADPGEKNTSAAGLSLAKTGSGMRRMEAGLRLRKYIEGSRLSPLGAMDYESATMGGGGGGSKLALPTYRLHCISALGSIKQMMQPADFALIESVVDKDRFIWEDFPARSAGKRKIFEALRYVLDIIACHDRLLTHDEFKELWDEELPDPERPVRSEAAALNEIAEELFRSGYE